MFIDSIFSILFFYIFIYFIEILGILGYQGMAFEEIDSAPWFVELFILIWVTITMFISIIMMVKRAGRFLISLFHK